MLGYAARAVPWTRVAVAAILVVVLMELVRWDAWMLWPLQGTAVGLLAGASAWCFDEQAGIVVDVAPRTLAWRSASRGLGVLVLVLAWVAVVLHAGDTALFGHRNAVLLQGLAALVAGAAYACWRRSLGEPTPGLLSAGVAVPATTAWALLHPFDEHLVVFPYGSASETDWQVSVIGWSLLGICAAVLIAAALAEAPWWGKGHAHRGGSPTRSV